jgi:hypothetical protein
MKVRGIKRVTMAAALAVVTMVSGMANQAYAFTFGEGDLVLAIYGNSTEAMYNLGTHSTLLAPGANTVIELGTAGLSAASVGTNQVRYTIFGWDLSAPSGMGIHAATSFAPAQITGTRDFESQFNPSVAMPSSFSGNTISSSNPASFSSNLNTAGAGRMEGAWPVAMQGTIDQILNIMRGDVGDNTFTQVGRVQFTSTGQLIIGNPGPAAVPLPAGVVLFGTGLIGLIGIARRSFNRMAA